MKLKKKRKQVKFKFKEIRLFIRNYCVIPKELRRMLVQLIIVIGQLTKLYLIDSNSENVNKVFDDALSIYSSRMKDIEEYINFIKER